MNRTTLEAHELKANFPEATNLGQLFQSLENEFRKKGQVICQFWINGLQLSESDESRLATTELTKVDKIDVDSQEPVALLFGLLDNWIKELPTLIQASDTLMNEIKFNGIDGQYKAFVELIESCQFLIDSLIALERIIEIEDKFATEWTSVAVANANAIRDALSAFEKQDFVQLSELLEYDLGNALQGWLDLLVRLNGDLKERYAKDPDSLRNKVFQKSQQTSVEAS